MNAQTSAMIAAAFNQDTISPNLVDVQQTPLYDAVSIAQAGSFSPATVTWFTVPVNTSGKTYADTNLSQSKQIPTPQQFSIQSFKLSWNPNALVADLISLLAGFVYEFYVGDSGKVYQRAPFWYYPAGGGIYGFFGPSNTLTTSTTNNGWPGRDATFTLNIPLVIYNTMTFYATVNGNAFTMAATGAGGVGMRMMNILDGFYARGVQ